MSSLNQPTSSEPPRTSSTYSINNKTLWLKETKMISSFSVQELRIINWEAYSCQLQCLSLLLWVQNLWLTIPTLNKLTGLSQKYCWVFIFRGRNNKVPENWTARYWLSSHLQRFGGLSTISKDIELASGNAANFREGRGECFRAQI